MSRVEEARRRAEGRDTLKHEDPADEFLTLESGPTEGISLERYPRERQRIEQARSPKPARSIVAATPARPSQWRGFDPSLDGKLVSSPNTPPIGVEQYRRLASSLHELQADRGLKTMMVTSAMPREGKTLTVINLALTLSESYRKRVLLIDADLRRPSLHEVFRLPKTLGLTEALKSGSRPHFIELSPLLSVLQAGEVDGDPLGALTSDRFAALLEQCAAAFDWVLLDAPPVGLMPDGNVLARLTKAVVFVIGAGSTPHTIIERAIAELGRDYIVGTVLNNIEEEQLPSASVYSSYYLPNRSSE
jgi:protein-tyrosine kinase